MMRNLGGAIGTAVLATMITKREQFHSNIIGQSVDARPRGGAQPDRPDRRTISWPMASPTPPPRIKQAIVALGKAVKHQAW